MMWRRVPLSKTLILADPGVWGPEDDKGGVSVLRSTNFNNDGTLDLDRITLRFVPNCKRTEKILAPGDIILERSGGGPRQPVGRVCYFPGDDRPHCFGNFCQRFRANTALCHVRYLFWHLYWLYVSGKTVQLQKQTHGIRNLEYRQYIAQEIPLPPLSEQRRIVEILDQADALRRKRAEADTKAARILPALFYKIFGDPATNPKGLVKKKLGDLIRVKSGNFLPVKNMNLAGHYPVYGGNGINGYHSEFMFEEPVIVLGRVGIYCGVVHYSEPNCWVTDNALYVAEQSKDLHPRYLAEALRVANLNQYAGRAGQPLISGNRIYPIEILVPPPEEQEKFASKIVHLHRHENRRLDAGDHIEQLFSVLLHRAFIGDLTARWRGAHMKELLAEIEVQALALECPPTKVNPPEIGSKRHAGHDMYNKAALAAYITDRCHTPDRPMGRVKLAKLFYLVQQKAEIELTETFMKRAAGPLDDEIHKFLSLAQKSKWLVLLRGEGDLKPVKPGTNVSKAIGQAEKLLGPAKAKVDEMLDQMKGWGYRALERWATILDASFELTAAGQPATVEGVKDIIQRRPDWVPKLNRDEFSDTNIEATLKGLRGFGFITNQD